MPATYEPIATTTLGSNTNTVTFSSIPSTYTDLVLVIRGTNSSSTDDVALELNGDTGTNYSRNFIDANGSTLAAKLSNNLGSAALGGYVGSGSNFVSIIDIMNYSNTTTFKTQLGRGNDPTGYLSRTVNLWRNTSAISSIVCKWYASSGQYGTGTTLSLYGIKAA
jgi:hypothetical protein